jgi:hypothetical protein
MRHDGLGGFVLRVFLWLPPCLAAWYYSATQHAAIAGWLARIFIDQFQSGIVTELERSGVDLVFVTSIKVHPAPGQTALLLPDVNPLVYTYGLAFMIALMLGARTQWWKILISVVALLPFQAWGIAFDILVQVGVKSGPEVSAQAGLFGWRLDVIALGYQIGNLIFPALIPVLLWAAFNRRFIENAIRVKARKAPASSE